MEVKELKELNLEKVSNEELKKIHTEIEKELKKRGGVFDKKTITLEGLIPLVEALGKTLGKNYEVALHDCRKEGNPIIAIENGHITGRKVGSISDLKFENDMELNYGGKTEDGKKLKSSRITIRSQDGSVLGYLSINLDTTSIEVAKNFLEDLSHIREEETCQESFPENVEDFLKLMVQKSLNRVPKPVTILTKEDKLQIVEFLYRNNIFNIKGSVDTVAKALNVSRYTIYNYIEEVSAKIFVS